MIIAEELRKQFGDFHAVKGVSLEVKPGEVLALLGPNGAGKTTSIRMLAAILKPTSGRAIVGGFNVETHAREVRHAVGLLTEFPGLYHRMKSLDYLLFFGRLQGMNDRDCGNRAVQLLQQFGLWEAREKRIDGYSKGMKQKLALIRAMIHDPNILYLDEPTTAMDPHSARTVRDAIAGLRSAQRSIILCTHNLNEAEELADRIAVVHDGGIAVQGTIAELSQQLMGDPIWELRLAQPQPELAKRLANLLTIEDVGADWLRYRTTEPHQLNPVLIQRISGWGWPLVSINEVQRSLEDVYLTIVGQTHRERVSATLEQPNAAAVAEVAL
ncbi:ABC transporter ATP-binding protein [Herpetosiphon gulosus]|uniref:Vitamin B12 import ATP-binding protein BtuD n=1 Tax=Herpetosiphon gulosus TaxID=1973496 RepID=A0ABP9WXG5_9CHLR